MNIINTPMAKKFPKKLYYFNLFDSYFIIIKKVFDLIKNTTNNN